MEIIIGYGPKFADDSQPKSNGIKLGLQEKIRCSDSTW